MRGHSRNDCVKRKRKTLGSIGAHGEMPEKGPETCPAPRGAPLGADAPDDAVGVSDSGTDAYVFPAAVPNVSSARGIGTSTVYSV